MKVSGYGLVPHRIVRNARWQTLPANHRLVLLHAYALETCGPAGIAYVDADAMARDCGLDSFEWKLAIDELPEFTFDLESSVLWLKEFLRFRKITPARLEAVHAAVECLPPDCELLERFRAMHAACWFAPKLQSIAGVCSCSTTMLSEAKQDGKRETGDGKRETGGARTCVRGTAKPHGTSSETVTKVAEATCSLINELAGSAFRPNGKVLRALVKARLSEGYSESDFMHVIRTKAAQWGSDSKMRQFLRPKTLLAAGNFESYIGEPAPLSLKPSAGQPTCGSGKHPPHPLYSCSTFEMSLDGFGS